jgi:hypothetical protein
VSECCDRKASILNLSTDPGIFEFSPVEAYCGRLKAPDDWVKFLEIPGEKCGTLLSKRLVFVGVSGEEKETVWRSRRCSWGGLKLNEGGADHPHIVEAKIMTNLFVPWIPEEKVALPGHIAGLYIA